MTLPVDQDANDLAVYTLTGDGYCGDILKEKLKETTTKEPITERNSQASIELLTKARTHVCISMQDRKSVV